jgi:hypothetical protein
MATVRSHLTNTQHRDLRMGVGGARVGTVPGIALSTRQLFKVLANQGRQQWLLKPGWAVYKGTVSGLLSGSLTRHHLSLPALCPILSLLSVV